MKETVYIETSFVSLLVADPSRDVSIAGNQQVTRDWWKNRRHLFQCFTSDETLREASMGDPRQARLRLEKLDGMPILEVTEESDELASQLLATGSLPPAARADASHLAVATLAASDYLLTWNCRHLANAQILRRLEREAARYGWKLPHVCTPQELMGDYTYGSETGPDI